MLVVACLVAQLATGTLAWAADDAPGSGEADPVLVGAGGIASCSSDSGDEATADLIEDMPGATVFTAGDNAYEKGTASQFAKCYDKSWGKFKDRTHPAIGNHDYATDSGGPYYSYFGDAAGEAGQGWYSYDLGAWHIIVLNSNCGNSKCLRGSAQEKWLKADLAASQARCTAAVIHHPRFSSDNVPGEGSQKQVAPLWDDLYAAGAELVISGHSRVYERFAPLTPAGKADPDYGLTLINVGTGGRGHANFISKPVANSVERERGTFGVLKLTLHAESYDFAFVPVKGRTYNDSGSRSCHGQPKGDPGDPGDGDGGGQPTRIGVRPDADATVVNTSPKKNLGKETSLLADADPTNAAFLRFTLSGIEGTVARARLRLWVTNGSGDGPGVYPTALGSAPTDPPWSESAITWNKRPARTGPKLDDVGSLSAGRYVDYDVTDAVTGDGAYGFELSSSGSDGTGFAARETKTSSQRPELIVDVEAPADPPAA
jgi:acid phosphatase type 7